MDCRNCQRKPVSKKTLDTARGTRLLRLTALAFAAAIIALVIAFVVVVVSINNKWADTVRKTNDRLAEYLGECDVIDYDRDGSGVNTIGDNEKEKGR